MDEDDEFELLRYQVRRFDLLVIVAAIVAVAAFAGLIEFARWCLTAWP